ncbi:MAG: NTP transferase domain-containing protein, partial [Candidatus Uhrbacteria bacterium]|nr:NTP transferase domain-containing protein [Candidatus Uhrbacteria bacterium]
MNSRQSDVACIVLAAGNALRFGRNKLFVPLGNKPLLFTVIDSIVSFRVAGKIVVVAALPEIRRVQKKYKRNP